MLVMKFGGTSVGTPERIRNVADLVAKAREREPVVVVVSALAGVTDLLLSLAEAARRTGEADAAPLDERHRAAIAALDLPPDLVDPELREARTLLTGVAMLRELTPRSRDCIASFGERMSARIVAATMARAGLPAAFVPAWEAGLITDARFGEARPLAGSARRMAEALLPRVEREVPVVTGFVARTEHGEVTTLGRGGSDLSAALFGAALFVREIEIWTDVDGVMTADPRIVGAARVLERISYAEAAELAYFGAKVLHPQTMQPAVERGIPIRVRNTLRPASPGTEIGPAAALSAEVVKSIALRRGVRVLNVQSSRMLGAHGFIRRLGEAFDRHGVPIDMMATSEVSVSITVGPEQTLDGVTEELAGFAEVSVLEPCAIVCVVGEGLRETPGIAARAFQALGRADVNVLMVSQGASRLNLGLVVEAGRADAAVQTLHRTFFEAAAT